MGPKQFKDYKSRTVPTRQKHSALDFAHLHQRHASLHFTAVCTLKFGMYDPTVCLRDRKTQTGFTMTCTHTRAHTHTQLHVYTDYFVVGNGSASSPSSPPQPHLGIAFQKWPLECQLQFSYVSEGCKEDDGP